VSKDTPFLLANLADYDLSALPFLEAAQGLRSCHPAGFHPLPEYAS
jgi:hypothetical protein